MALLLLFVASLSALDYRVDVWNTENGLPDNFITALCQTRDGYLWLTTNAGLVRFDGLRFRVFDTSNTPELKSDRYTAFALMEDSHGALWAGTKRGGVVRYSEGAFSAYDTANGLPGNTVLRIDEDDRGVVWIYTSGGLAKWESGSLTRAATPPAPGERSGAVAQAGLASVLGVDNIFFGLWQVDKSGWYRFAYGRWVPMGLPPVPGLTSPADLRVVTMIEDSRRKLWFALKGTPNAAFAVSEDGRLTQHAGVTTTDLHVGYEDRRGRLLVGSHAGQVGLLENGQFHAIPGLTTYSVFRALEDRAGQLWIGTKEAGLFRVRDPLVSVYRHPGGPELNAGHALIRDRHGAFWFGTAAGLARFDHGRLETFFQQGFRRYEPPNVITALHEEKDGSIWVGTLAGIARFHDGRLWNDPDLSPRVRAKVNAIHRDRAGNLWVATVAGLWRVPSRQPAVVEYKGVVRSILEDRDGVIWIGTDFGLSRYTGAGFESFASSAVPGAVISLFEDKEGILWAGTAERGLVRVAHDQDRLKFTRYTTRNGLFNNSPYQLLEDDAGYFWITCRLGVYRIRKQELNEFAAGSRTQITSTHFGADELSRLAISPDVGSPGSIRAPDGTFWFATMGGIVSLNPRSVPVNPVPPSAIIEDCVVNSQPANCRQGLRLGPSPEGLEVNYTGLSLVRSNQIRFRYRLEGLEKDWVEAGTRRTAYYPRLPAGEYAFRVIAANSDGVWGQDAAVLQITVLPPFYETWWFMSLIAALILALAAWVHNRRLSQLRMANAEQERFARQLIELQEGERKRIAAELHDSLGQNLLLIKNHATMGLISAAFEPSLRTQFDEIVSSATHSIEEVREIAANLRPHHLDRLGLTQALEAMIEKAASSTTIALHGEIDDIDGLFPKDAEITVFRVVQESISNILKHSQATEAFVRVQSESESVSIVIQDNGLGFDPNLRSKGRGGFGLTGIAERVRILGGHLAIDSTPGRGTTVRVRWQAHDLARAVQNGG